MAKKKQRLVLNYKKGTEANRREILSIINDKDTKEIYLLQNAKYDDGSESFTIQVHFMSTAE